MSKPVKKTGRRRPGEIGLTDKKENDILIPESTADPVIQPPTTQPPSTQPPSTQPPSIQSPAPVSRIQKPEISIESGAGNITSPTSHCLEDVLMASGYQLLEAYIDPKDVPLYLRLRNRWGNTLYMELDRPSHLSLKDYPRYSVTNNPLVISDKKELLREVAPFGLAYESEEGLAFIDSMKERFISRRHSRCALYLLITLSQLLIDPEETTLKITRQTHHLRNAQYFKQNQALGEAVPIVQQYNRTLQEVYVLQAKLYNRIVETIHSFVNQAPTNISEYNLALRYEKIVDLDILNKELLERMTMLELELPRLQEIKENIEESYQCVSQLQTP